MQVYKIFFRILNKQKGQIILYLAIFLGIATLVSSQAQDNSVEKQFVSTTYPIAIFDEDNSEASRHLTAYLERQNERIDIADDGETIQDELYNQNIVCVVRIPEGFGESLRSGSEAEKLEFTSIPGTIYSENFKSMINHYISTIRSYLAGGFSDEKAQKRAEEVCMKEVTVSMTDENGNGHSALYYYFAYLPYIMISICTVGIGPILIVFNKKEVRERNICSSYPLTRMNLELIAGTVTTGLGMCVCYCIMVLVGTRSLCLFCVKGALHCLNMLCFMVICLGLVFLVGQVIKQANALSMVSNVIALGMSFLCGIFVPLEFLGEGLIRAAHFLPAYWYITTADFVDRYSAGTPMGDYWMGLGVEILFGAALVAAGLAYSKAKAGGNIHISY